MFSILVTTFKAAPEDVNIEIQAAQTIGPSTAITAISDFPEKAYQPKVQLPFFTAPGACPRKIEIERRKRHFGQQSIEKNLTDRGIDTSQLMPKKQPNGFKSVKLNADSEDPAPFPPYLSLDIFDDDEFDCRTPQEWIEMGKENGVRKPVPGRALLPTRDDTHNRKYKNNNVYMN